MDLQGKADKFPNPGAVLVDASKLSSREKALILYRHSRAGKLKVKEKALIPDFAESIVGHNHFTPERIRTFVVARVPELLKGLKSRAIDNQAFSAEVQEAIRNPTERMKKSFRALDPSHQWLLISLLELGAFAEKEQLEELYLHHCPLGNRSPFDDVFNELTESFLKVRSWPRYGGDWIDWTHPSYRDLVIDELARNARTREEFLTRMSLEGIKLAISDLGGATGERAFPLMVSRKNWSVLESRCVSIVRDGSNRAIESLLDALRSAINHTEEEKRRENLLQILGAVIEHTRKRWDDADEALLPSILKTFCEASLLLEPLPALPDLENSWESVEDEFDIGLRANNSDKSLEPHWFEDWIKLVKIISENEPRFLRQINFPGAYEGKVLLLINRLREEIEYMPIVDSADELRAEGNRLNAMAELIEELGSVDLEQKEDLETLAEQLKDRAGELEGEAIEMEPAEHDDNEYDLHRNSEDSFNVASLFSDL